MTSADWPAAPGPTPRWATGSGPSGTARRRNGSGRPPRSITGPWPSSGSGSVTTRGTGPSAAKRSTGSGAWAAFGRVEFQHVRREAESLVGKPPLSAAAAIGWARRFAARHRLGQADRAQYAFDRAAKAAGALVVPTDRRIDEVGQPA